jgi:hypothetical protein
VTARESDPLPLRVSRRAFEATAAFDLARRTPTFAGGVTAQAISAFFPPMQPNALTYTNTTSTSVVVRWLTPGLRGGSLLNHQLEMKSGAKYEVVGVPDGISAS